MRKILIALHGDEVSPRFDLTREAWIGSIHEGQIVRRRNVVLPQASAESLCHLAVTEDVDTLVCGGMEDEFYQYLHWKRIDVIDNVIGPLEAVVQAYTDGTLTAGAVLPAQGGGPCPDGNTGTSA